MSVCLEYGSSGITSNVIAPGPIEGTEGMARLIPTDAVAPQDRQDGATAIPTGRWGKASEIADATVYLFSQAGNYVNGATLVVDGGAWRTNGINTSKWAEAVRPKL